MINLDLAEKLPGQFNLTAGNLNSIAIPGMYSVALSSVENSPETSGWGCMLVWILDNNPNYICQKIISTQSSEIYFRSCSNNSWSTWTRYSNFSNTQKVVPYLYKFMGAEKPLFVISENAGDTMYCNGRGCKRLSDEKALIFKVNGYTLKSGSISSGYGIISKSLDGVLCEELTQYGGIGMFQALKTPSGNSVYCQELLSKWVGITHDHDVIATINGEEQHIKTTAKYLGVDGVLFLSIMADFYLF